MVNGVRLTALRSALIVIGLTFTFGLYPLIHLWPSGWSWGDSHYLHMIMAIYAVLGVFVVLAARDPLEHRSLIWFVVWSSVAHAIVMAIPGIADPTHRGHLFGDVPALLVVAAVLAVLTPVSPRASSLGSSDS